MNIKPQNQDIFRNILIFACENIYNIYANLWMKGNNFSGEVR